MQVNWMAISCFVIVFFAISGFSRGWWKEAITTVILAIFIFFLQNPSLAEAFINLSNSILVAIWQFIPGSLITLVNDFTETVLGFNFGTDPLQFDPGATGTWLTLLLVTVGASILLGRISLGYPPLLFGKLIGLGIGGFNGFLILSLIREYLDGRALPGSQAASTQAIVITSSNTYAPPASSYTLQFTSLPNYTILDSVIPWVLIGGAVLLLFAVLKTRLGIATSNDGKKIQPKAPPFHRGPKIQPPADPLDTLKKALGLG